MVASELYDDPRGVLANALNLAAAGHPILPTYMVGRDGKCTCHGKDRKTGEPCTSGKHPMSYHQGQPVVLSGLNEASTNPTVIVGWFDLAGGNLNFGWRCDKIGVPDVDVSDAKVGDATMDNLQVIHGQLSETLTVRTGRGGVHRVYALPESITDTTVYSDKLGTDVDFKRGPGHYIMVPGSRTQGDYTIESGQLLVHTPLDPWVHDLALAIKGREDKANARVNVADQPIKSNGKNGQVLNTANWETTKGWLAAGAKAADDPDRGNNNAASFVGGVVADCLAARQPIHVAMRLALAMEYISLKPQEPATIESMVRRFWKQSETTRIRQENEPDGSRNGWLVASPCGTRIISTKSDSEWGNFNIEVVGIIKEEGNNQFDVIVTRYDGEKSSALLPASTASSTHKLSNWLSSNFRVSFETPESEDKFKSMANGTRMLRYLDSQKASIAEITKHLGWDDKTQMFLTNEGAILGVPNETGLSPYQGVRPHPDLRSNVPCAYGFECTEDEMTGAVRQMVTFHHPEFAALFWSAIVAQILKGQVDKYIAIWPVFAVLAPSGSAKSKGMAPMGMRLMGHSGNSGLPTGAGFRDALSGHRNLPPWFDDPEEIAKHWDMIRNATSGGGSSKKAGEGWNKTEHSAFVNTPWIFAENIESGGQKAHEDRFNVMEARDPKDRRSKNDPKRPQWDDIEDFIDQWGNMSQYAGRFVSMVLQRRDMVDRSGFRKIRGEMSGRHGDKLALFLAGATVLVDILGPEAQWILDEVTEHVTKEYVRYDASANRMTNVIFREYIARHGLSDGPRHVLALGGAISPLIYRKDADGNMALWVNTQHMALAWHTMNKGNIVERTDTESAMKGQLKQSNFPPSRTRTNPGFGKNINWTQIKSGDMDVLYRRVPDNIRDQLVNPDGVYDID